MYSEAYCCKGTSLQSRACPLVDIAYIHLWSDFYDFHCVASISSDIQAHVKSTDLVATIYLIIELFKIMFHQNM